MHWLFALLLMIPILACAVAATAGYGAVTGLLAVVLVIAIAAVTPALAVQAVLLLTVAVVCRRRAARRHTFSLAVVAVTVCTISAAYAYLAMERSRIAPLVERARREYPYLSLDARLSFERDTPQSAPDGQPANFAVDLLTADSKESLADSESRFDAYSVTRRHRALKYLHAQSLDDFVEAESFGVMRMLPEQRSPLRYIDLPEVAPVPQPQDADEDCVERLAVHEAPAAPSTRLALTSLHKESYEGFANPEGFGHVRHDGLVAGFVSHRFMEMPTGSDVSSATRRWQVSRLELVSLLKFAEPAVYVSEYLPNMDELRDAPTRPLDEFEHGGLSSLRGGEQLVVDERPGELRMLGAVRAARQCLDCHSVRRGELLGAFSYRLHPADMDVSTKDR
jgi:hypothetical protein